MVTLLGIPVLTLLVILQTSVISRLNISYGQADLVMIFILAWTLQEKSKTGLWWAIAAGMLLSIVSAVPLYGYLIGYCLITLIAIFARKRLWKIPMMIMVVLSFIGTFIVLVISFGLISVTQVSLPFMDSFVKIMLPSAAMNMVLGIPVFIVVKDLADMVYPTQKHD